MNSCELKELAMCMMGTHSLVAEGGLPSALSTHLKAIVLTLCPLYTHIMWCLVLYICKNNQDISTKEQFG